MSLISTVKPHPVIPGFQSATWQVIKADLLEKTVCTVSKCRGIRKQLYTVIGKLNTIDFHYWNSSN